MSEKDFFETHRLYHSRRRYTRAMQDIAKLHKKPYPKIIPANKLKVRSWNRLVAYLDWIRMQFGLRNQITGRHWFLKLRGFILNNHIHSKCVPEKYVNIKKNFPLVLITEGDMVGNKGAVAMVNCIIRDIRARFPDARFVVSSISLNKNINYEEGIDILSIKFPLFDLAVIKAGFWYIFSKIGIRLEFLLDNNIVKTYQKADIVISATGISFIEDFGYSKIYNYSRYLLLPLMLNKKVIKFTQSIGPILSNYNKFMARSLLPLATQVMARGRHSMEHLKKVGIESNVVAFPDIALTLESEYSEKVKNIVSMEGAYIGISPNNICNRLSREEYISTLKEIINYIEKELPELKILFIPHTISKTNLGKGDDYEICLHLKSMLAKERSSIADTLSMSPGELKALIGRAEFFIGSRYHALVAAISMKVPCLAIGWHWKYNELMEWYGLDDNIINVWELGETDVTSKFYALYNERIERKVYLEKISDEIEKLARVATETINAELLK